MLRGAAGGVGRAILESGDGTLAPDVIEIFRPIKPMLASPASSVESAIEALGGSAMLEHKLDGWRIQVHKQGDEVRAYTRRLNEETGAISEIIERVRALLEPGPSDTVVEHAMADGMRARREGRVRGIRDRWKDAADAVGPRALVHQRAQRGG